MIFISQFNFYHESNNIDNLSDTRYEFFQTKDICDNNSDSIIENNNKNKILQVDSKQYECTKSGKKYVYTLVFISEYELQYSFKCFDSTLSKLINEESGKAELNDGCDESIEIPSINDNKTGSGNLEMVEVSAICYWSYDSVRKRRIGFEFDSSYTFLVVKDFYIQEDAEGIWTTAIPMRIIMKP